jgi:hypothetical protein
MLCGSIGSYQCSRGTYSLHLQSLLLPSTMKLEGTGSSKTLISNYETTCSHKPKITMQFFATIKTSNLIHVAMFDMAIAIRIQCILLHYMQQMVNTSRITIFSLL